MLLLLAKKIFARHFITEEAAAKVKIVHPSIFYPRFLLNRAKPIHRINLLNSRCYGVIWIACKREDPPVKAIISVRRQVLLQFIVGLLYLPTEVFQLAVQRVLRAGRVVAAVHDRSEPSGGSTKNNGECGETELGSHRTPTTTRLYCSVV